MAQNPVWFGIHRIAWCSFRRHKLRHEVVVQEEQESSTKVVSHECHKVTVVRDS